MAFNLQVPAVIKEHPVATGGVILVGALVLFLMLRGGSPAQVVTTGAATDPNAAAAATQVALAQIQGQQQGSTQNFQLAYLQQQQQGDLAAAQLADQSHLAETYYTTDAQKDVQLAGLSSQLALSQANIAGQVNLQKMATDAQVNLANISAATQVTLQQGVNQSELQQSLIQADVSKYQTAANLQALATQTQANVTIAGLNANTQDVLAGFQRDIAAKQIDATTEQAKMNTDAQIAAIQGQTQIAGINAKVQKQQSSNNLIGGIVGGLLSFL